MQSVELIDAFVTVDVAAFVSDTKSVRSARSPLCSEFSMPAPLFPARNTCVKASNWC